MQIKKATRQGIKPLIVLYSESGCGKSFSSLLLARGFVGPAGKIVLGDSESGRGSLYADVLDGGYEVVEIEPPFTPQRHVEFIDLVEKSGASIGILDSGSHEWEGVGGVLDMAADIEAKKGKGLHCWAGPKFEHAQFVQRLLRSSIPWIVCLRSKFKTRQVKNAEGRKEVIKDDYTSPIQAEDFIFEATAHAEILRNHSIVLTKCSHPALAKCFPTEGPITIKHGELLAQWCNAPKGPGTHQPATQPASKPTKEIAALKNKLWDITKEYHQGDKAKLQQWLIDEMIIEPEMQLDTMTEAMLKGAVLKTERKLFPVTP